MKALRVPLVLAVCIGVVLASSACAKPAAKPTTAPKPTTTVTATATATATVPAQVFNLTLASPYAKIHPISVTDDWFASELSKRTNGRVNVKVYYDATLFPAPEGLAKLREGTVDFAYVLISYFGGEVPLSNGIFELNFVSTNTWARGKAATELTRSYKPVRDEWEVKNGVRASFGEGGNAFLFAKKPFTQPSDIKGLKFRSYGMYVDLVKLYGADPVTGILPGDWYESLKRGVIDGILPVTIAPFYTWKVFEVAPHAIDAGWGSFGNGGIGVSLKTYNKLPADIQATIDKLLDEWPDAVTQNIIDYVQNTVIAGSTAGGGKFYVLSPAKQQQWLAPLNPEQFKQNKVKELDGKGMPGTELYNLFTKRVQELEKSAKLPGELDIAKKQGATTIQ